jgi:hypothetical protein
MIVTLSIVAVVVVAAAGFVARGRRQRDQTDDIDSFRRQIDALSSHSRRQTSDRMKPSSESAGDDDGGHDR